MSTPPPHPRPNARGAERRRDPRARADWPLSIRVGGERVEVRVRDVSAAGVCFFLERPLPEMAVVELALELPADGGPRHVAARGAVVRCQPISPRLEHYEIAVFLHDIRDDDRRRLADWVQTELARRAAPAATGG